MSNHENLVILKGEVKKAPAVSFTGKGTKSARVTLFVSTEDTKLDGEPFTRRLTYNIKAYGDKANQVEGLKVGQLVRIKGKLACDYRQNGNSFESFNYVVMDELTIPSPKSEIVVNEPSEVSV